VAYAGALTDRWFASISTGFSWNFQQTAGPVLIPGTNYAISSKFWRFSNPVAISSPAAASYLAFYQSVEAPMWRELSNDVHSISILLRSSVANLKIGLFVVDTPQSKTLSKLITLGAANTWTLMTFPNLPVFPAGNFSLLPGNVGYLVGIHLVAGSNYTTSANDTWLSNTGGTGAIGLTNAYPINSTVDFAFFQHEPGPCTQLMDLDFDTNLTRSQRYFQKSYDYGTKPGSIGGTGAFVGIINANFSPGYNFIPFKRTMAKAPTMAGYSNITGAINMARDVTANVDRAVTGANNIGDAGFSGFNLSAVNAALWICNFHYTADTGW
jgi:hypothetical protein